MTRSTDNDKAGGSPDGKLTFLALGDSYTVGEAVEPNDSWPWLLATSMREAGKGFRDPLIIARTGWTTDELLEGITAANPQGTYDLVSLLIGVNNLYRSRTTENYKVEFKALLGLAVQFAGGNPRKVVVLSIPDWGATPFAEGKDRVQIALETDRFNAVNRAEAAAAGVHYVDVTGVSRSGLEDLSLLTSDGLHPSAAMYRIWADMVEKTLSSK